MYEIKYLPLARDDLIKTINYITTKLKAPKAANDLLNEIETSILRLEQFPFCCRLYKQYKDIKKEYRLLPVKNYAIFYVVEQSVVEIHRVLYAKMNLDKNL
jgi:toxin ParE1/3/4